MRFLKRHQHEACPTIVQFFYATNVSLTVIMLYDLVTLQYTEYSFNLHTPCISICSRCVNNQRSCNGLYCTKSVKGRL